MKNHIILVVIYALIVIPGCKDRIESASSTSSISDSYEASDWFLDLKKDRPTTAALFSDTVNELKESGEKWKLIHFEVDHGTGKVLEISGADKASDPKNKVYFKITADAKYAFSSEIRPGSDEKLGKIIVSKFKTSDLKDPVDGIVMPLDFTIDSEKFKSTLISHSQKYKLFISSEIRAAVPNPDELYSTKSPEYIFLAAFTFSLVAPLLMYLTAKGLAGTATGPTKILPAVYFAMLLSLVGIWIVWTRLSNKKQHLESQDLIDYIKDTKQIPFTP